MDDENRKISSLEHATCHAAENELARTAVSITTQNKQIGTGLRRGVDECVSRLRWISPSMASHRSLMMTPSTHCHSHHVFDGIAVNVLDLNQGTSTRFLRSLSALPAQTRFFVQMNTGEDR